ncbi:TPA: dethiobiotin synthase [bacterium]|nr:dethiobiotin synthase [bacterium]
MEALFITGTDTDIGKTLVTGLLGWWLDQRGLRVITQKWVETGNGGDIDLHLQIMKRPKEEFERYIDLMLPYSFSLPSSPHLAAEVEGRTIDPERIKEKFESLSQEFEYLLVEGAGGLLVPINRESFLIDVAQEVGLSILVVAGNRLGAINHTLLTLEVLKQRGMKVVGVVFNTYSKDQNRLITKDNPRVIERFYQDTVLGVLEFGEIEDLYEEFKPIGEKIFKRWIG